MGTSRFGIAVAERGATRSPTQGRPTLGDATKTPTAVSPPRARCALQLGNVPKRGWSPKGAARWHRALLHQPSAASLLRLNSSLWPRAESGLRVYLSELIEGNVHRFNTSKSERK